MKIAIDFDGTCVKHAYPDIGKDIGAVPVLKALADVGHKLILFTMRSNESSDGNVLDAAVEWFKQNDIPLHGINTDPDQKSWTGSPKAYAELYIDDRGLGMPLISPDGEKPYVDWGACERLLREIGALPEMSGSIVDGGSE